MAPSWVTHKHMKRLYLAITGVLILLIGLGLMWWLDRAAPLPEVTPVPPSTSGLFPPGDDRPLPTPPSSISASSTEPEDGTLTDRSGRFFRLSSKPVGGAIILNSASSSDLVYVERATGHLYRFRPQAGGAERISNTTIPKVYNLAGGTAGTSTRIAFQYLKDGQIQSFLSYFNLSATRVGDDFLSPSNPATSASQGSFLPTKLLSLSFSPANRQLFWLERGGNEVVGYLTDWNGEKKEAIWRSPHPEWQATWIATSTIALSTSPSVEANGSLYYLTPKTKKLEAIITNVPGLTVLPSPKLDQVLYSAQGQGRLITGLYSVAERFYGRFEIQTWADKCVWEESGTGVYCAVPTNLSANYQYPDSWYRGEVSTNDNIWRFDVTTGRGEIIFNPSQSGLNITLDADNLLLSADGGRLYLNNRSTGQLWGLNLQTAFANGE